ncbi:hypothetical protein OIV83_003094 [Microbotryomycetes sp. JL201]|nr:hypothetical protein OIV83_003094 [Microbotryomycetes sp. JL201]
MSGRPAGEFNGNAFRQRYPNYDAPFNPNPAASIVIYGYVPSLGLAITACIVYGVFMLVHFGYFCLRRARGTRWFQGLLWFGALLEVAGYAVRSLSNGNPFIVNYFVVQYFLIVVAPVFISAAFYLALSDGLNRLPPDTKRTLIPFKSKIFVIIFIVFDVVTTIVQIAGAALVGVAESASVRNDGDGPNITSQEANRILMAGLAVQRRLKASVFGYAFTSEILFGCLDFAPVALSLIIWALFPLFRIIPPVTPGSLAAQKYGANSGEGLHAQRSSPTLSPTTETPQIKFGKERTMV